MLSTHFKITKEEQFFVNKVESLIEKAKKNCSFENTDFISPNVWPHIKYLLKTTDVKVKRFKINEFAEYSILMTCPDYLEFDETKIPISALKIDIIGDGIITHRDVLGSVLNLGIKREKIGDIFINDTEIFLIAIDNMSDFIIDNLIKIKNYNFQIEKVPLNVVKTFKPDFKETYITVSSLRLDLLISKAFHLSRKDSQMYFVKGKVKINHGVILSYKKDAHLNDLISVRGHGRFKLIEESGVTKKGNIRLRIYIFK